MQFIVAYDCRTDLNHAYKFVNYLFKVAHFLFQREGHV